MKKRIVLLLLVVFALVQLSAYDVQAKGVKGGLNIATTSEGFLEDIEPESKFGLIIGGFVTYKINDQFSFQPEVYFTMKGVEWDIKKEDEYGSYLSEGSYNLNYLEIPLLGVLNIPIKASFDPRLFFGPSIGINLSATWEEDSEDTYYNGNEYITESSSIDGDLDEASTIELGLTLGGAVVINQIIIDLRYNMGLTDSGNDGDYFTNRVFSMMLGYKF